MRNVLWYPSVKDLDRCQGAPVIAAPDTAAHPPGPPTFTHANQYGQGCSCVLDRWGCCLFFSGVKVMGVRWSGYVSKVSESFL